MSSTLARDLNNAVRALVEDHGAEAVARMLNQAFRALNQARIYCLLHDLEHFRVEDFVDSGFEDTTAIRALHRLQALGLVEWRPEYPPSKGTRGVSKKLWSVHK